MRSIIWYDPRYRYDHDHRLRCNVFQVGKVLSLDIEFHEIVGQCGNEKKIRALETHRTPIHYVIQRIQSAMNNGPFYDIILE